MPAFPIREKLIPYRILAYLLYAPVESTDWILAVESNLIRVSTGPMGRALKMRNAQLNEALRWLEENHLVEELIRGKKGTLVIKLRKPSNICSVAGFN